VRQWRSAALVAGAVFGVLLAAGALRAAEGDDDLSLVRRALASAAHDRGRPAPDEAAPRPEPRTGRRGVRLRVAVAGPEGEQGSLSLEMPLSWLAAVLDRPRATEGDREQGLAPLLDVLRSAQSLVSVESDEGRVRVWVE